MSAPEKRHLVKRLVDRRHAALSARQESAPIGAEEGDVYR
jgi:hypothetical protein